MQDNPPVAKDGSVDLQKLRSLSIESIPTLLRCEVLVIAPVKYDKAASTCLERQRNTGNLVHLTEGDILSMVRIVEDLEH
jgi:hypothetical protein